MTDDAMSDALMLARATAILEGVTDGILLVLKGHLLIEEALYSIVRAKLLYPEFLEKANLRFPQLLNLARALYPASPDDKNGQLKSASLWEAVEALNTLRNRLAHNLEPRNLSSLLVKLMVIETEKVVSLDDPHISEKLGLTVASLVGYFLGLATLKK